MAGFQSHQPCLRPFGDSKSRAISGPSARIRSSDRPHQLAILFFEPVAFAAFQGVHPRQRESVVAHRQIRCGVEPVFERSAFANKPIEVRRLVVRHAIPQRMVMRARNDRNRIDLHVAELFECAMGCVDAAAERRRARQTLRVERNAAQLVAWIGAW